MGRKKRTQKTLSQADVIAAIREAAKSVKPDPAKFAAAARYTEAAKKAKGFDYDRRTPDGVHVYYFHHPGETLTGILGKPQRSTMMRGVAVGWEYIYPIVLDDDSLVYLPNNKRLRTAIAKADCLFQRITITYEGKKATAHGHYEKVYSVEPAPLGKDGVGPAGHKVLAQAAEEAKTRKKRRAKG